MTRESCPSSIPIFQMKSTAFGMEFTWGTSLIHASYMVQAKVNERGGLDWTGMRCGRHQSGGI